jgi:hypothetical protein
MHATLASVQPQAQLPHTKLQALIAGIALNAFRMFFSLAGSNFTSLAKRPAGMADTQSFAVSTIKLTFATLAQRPSG